jgi:hypothetical protein
VVNRRSLLKLGALAAVAPRAMAAPVPVVVSGIDAWLPVTTDPFFGINRAVDPYFSWQAARWRAMEVSYREQLEHLRTVVWETGDYVFGPGDRETRA